MLEPSLSSSCALQVAVAATFSPFLLAALPIFSPPSSSLTWPLTDLVPSSVVGQLCVEVALYAVQVVPPSQLKRYVCVSAVPGSTTSVSERLMLEPSLTSDGALKVADGATFLTVTLAEYSGLSPPSSSLTWPLTDLVPSSVVGQLCVEVALYAVQVVPPSQLKRYVCVSAVPGSTTSVSERLMLEPSLTSDGALKVADGATLFTVSANEVLVEPPFPSFAVMVTVWLCAGPSVVAYDHDHIPDAFVPDFVTVPTDAESVTVSPAFASDHVPLLLAVWPSLAETLALPAAMVGGEFAGAPT